MPRAVVAHPGGGGSTATVTDEAVDVAVLLSWHARPGVAWQALGLAVAEAGLPISDETLRNCLRWLLALEERSVARYVDKVSIRLREQHQHSPDELDLAEAIAAMVKSSRHERVYFRINGPIFEERFPEMTRRQRYELMRTNMLWNVAERLGEELVGETVRLAQGWRDDDEAEAAGFVGQCDPARVTHAELLEVTDGVTVREHGGLRPAALETLPHLSTDAAPGLLRLALLRAITQLRIAWMGDAARSLGEVELARLDH
jgi:hypothetical protein